MPHGKDNFARVVKTPVHMADDLGTATARVYARALFTAPLGRNNTMFRIEFANHASEHSHPFFRVIFRYGACANDSGPLASRAMTTPFWDAQGDLVIVGTATGLQPGQVYTLILRDVAHNDEATYDPQTYQVTGVSIA